VDPEAGTDPDLDAIAADLAVVETTLDELADGSYRHDDAEPEPPAP
jgi:hypothetical protein